MPYSLPFLTASLRRAVYFMRLVGLHDVPLLYQAASPPLHHVGADDRVTIAASSSSASSASSALKTRGHVQGEAVAVQGRRGRRRQAGHVREVERVVDGREALGPREQLRALRRLRRPRRGVSGPALRVLRRRVEEVVHGRAATTHDHPRPGPRCRPSARPRSPIVVARVGQRRIFSTAPRGWSCWGVVVVVVAVRVVVLVVVLVVVVHRQRL